MGLRQRQTGRLPSHLKSAHVQTTTQYALAQALIGSAGSGDHGSLNAAMSGTTENVYITLYVSAQETAGGSRSL